MRQPEEARPFAQAGERRLFMRVEGPAVIAWKLDSSVQIHQRACGLPAIANTPCGSCRRPSRLRLRPFAKTMRAHRFGRRRGRPSRLRAYETHGRVGIIGRFEFGAPVAAVVLEELRHRERRRTRHPVAHARARDRQTLRQRHARQKPAFRAAGRRQHGRVITPAHRHRRKWREPLKLEVAQRHKLVAAPRAQERMDGLGRENLAGAVGLIQVSARQRISVRAVRSWTAAWAAGDRDWRQAGSSSEEPPFIEPRGPVGSSSWACSDAA